MHGIYNTRIVLGPISEKSAFMSNLSIDTSCISIDHVPFRKNQQNMVIKITSLQFLYENEIREFCKILSKYPTKEGEKGYVPIQIQLPMNVIDVLKKFPALSDNSNFICKYEAGVTMFHRYGGYSTADAEEILKSFIALG